MHLTLQERLKLKQAQLKASVDRINVLEAEKQQETQNALRIDGAVKEIAEQIEAEVKEVKTLKDT